jgi:hypothetical protein
MLQDYPSFIPKESQHNLSRCAWPGRGVSVTELVPFMNFLVHSYTCCSDRHASPYWTFIRRWISMGYSSALLKKRMTERCSSLLHVASGAAIFHYYCVVVLHCRIILTPVGHSSNHEYHCCQLTRQSSCVSNFYRTFKVFIWLSLVCVYVGMYEYMYICTLVFMYICMYVCMHICLYVCTYIFMLVCMYVSNIATYSIYQPTIGNILNRKCTIYLT